MQIRQACAEDAAALLALEKQVHAQSEFMLLEPDEVSNDVEAKARQLKLIANSDIHACLVAVDGDQLIAYCGANGNSIRRRAHAARIWMGVTQDCWGQGVGAALMNAVIEWLEARGVQRIELVVATDNRRALRLYRRYGFEIEGCQRGAVRLAEGDWRDDYQMARLSSQLQRELAEAEAK